MTFKRPTHNGEPHGQFVTTPVATMLFQLLGGRGCLTIGSVALTQDQMTKLQKFYGYTPEQPNTKPEPDPEPQRAEFETSWDFERAIDKWKASVKALERWKDPKDFLQAGADRNAIRFAEVDGLRLLAWLLKYAQPGEDPLKMLVELACEAGWDVDPSDVSWARDEADEEDREVASDD